MPMIEGSVAINPVTGTVIAQVGCAGEVFAVLKASSNFGTLAASNPPAYAKALEQLAVMARAIAKVIPHIVTNAVIPPGIEVVTAGSATTQTGATTAPGTIT